MAAMVCNEIAIAPTGNPIIMPASLERCFTGTPENEYANFAFTLHTDGSYQITWFPGALGPLTGRWLDANSGVPATDIQGALAATPTAPATGWVNLGMQQLAVSAMCGPTPGGCRINRYGYIHFRRASDQLSYGYRYYEIGVTTAGDTCV